MQEAAKDIGRAVALFIVGAASLIFVAVLLAVPQQARSTYCTDLELGGGCDITWGDLAVPVLAGLGLAAFTIEWGISFLSGGIAALHERDTEQP